MNRAFGLRMLELVSISSFEDGVTSILVIGRPGDKHSGSSRLMFNFLRKPDGNLYRLKGENIGLYYFYN